MSGTRVRSALALALLFVAAATGYHAVKRLIRQSAIAAAGDAVAAGRYQAALDASETLTGADAEGRIAAECRCWALLSTDREDACTRLLDGLLEQPDAADWVPETSRTLFFERVGGGKQTSWPVMLHVRKTK